MSSDFATKLEQCLSQVESSQARVQSCLVSYPALAPELEPLLHTAQALRTAPRAELSPAAEARIAAQIFGPARQAPLPERRLQRRRRLRFDRSWVLGALGVILIVALLASAGLAYAATDALPGSALYPAKLATEAAWLGLAPPRAEAALHLRFAERRLAEVETLAHQRVVEPESLGRMAWHVAAVLEAARGMPQERALPLLQAVVQLSSREEAVLARLLAQVPAQKRAHLEQALLKCREHGRQARAAVGAGQPWPGEDGQLPPGQMRTPPGQETRPAGLQPPPGQEGIPPGLNKPAGDTDGEEKAAEKEEKEAEKEAAEEEKEEDKEDKEEEKDEEKEDREEEKEEDKEDKDK